MLAVSSSSVAPVLSYQGHKSGISRISWSPDGNSLASGSCDGEVHVWQAATGDCVYPAALHATTVLHVAWSPDGRWLATVDAEDTLQMWYMSRFSLSFPGPRFPGVCAVAWSPTGRHLAVGTPQGGMHIWDLEEGHDVWAYKLPYVGPPACRVPNQTNVLAFSPDGSRIAAGGLCALAEIRSVATGAACLEARACGHPSQEMQALAWSPDGMRIASASGDRLVRVWNPQTGERVASLRGSDIAHVRTVDWSSAGSRIAAGDDEGRVVVWDPVTGRQKFAYTAHTRAVRSVAWSPDGMQLASGSSDGTVCIIELPVTHQR